jgi:hypothetical protein
MGLYNPLIDGDQFHSDEITVIGPASIRGQVLDAVNFVTVDYEAAARRNLGYIRANIARSKAREAGLKIPVEVSIGKHS